MFESFEKRQPRKSAVQPVLALMVHAGLISLALRGGSNPALDGNPIPQVPPAIFVLPQDPVTGATLPRGTGGELLVPVPTGMTPGLPPLTRLEPGPISRPIFDPGRFLPGGTADTVSSPGVAVLVESGLTDPPRALHLAEPRYPEALRQAGIEGAVSVTYIVDAAGLVETTSITIVSSDHPAFAEAVLASVGKARFTPGRVHGRAVRVLVRQIFRFATQS